MEDRGHAKCWALAGSATNLSPSGQQMTASGRRFSCRAIHLKYRSIIEAHGRQMAAPKATGIQCQQIVFDLQSKRRPVAGDEHVAGATPARHVEPWYVVGRCGACFTLGLEFHDAVE